MNIHDPSILIHCDYVRIRRKAKVSIGAMFQRDSYYVRISGNDYVPSFGGVSTKQVLLYEYIRHLRRNADGI